MNKLSERYSITENGQYTSFTPNRGFYLTQDDPAATNKEAFWAVTADFPVANSPATLAVLSGLDDGVVFPVLIPSPGVMVPARGIGVMNSGLDVHGTPVNTSLLIDTISAYGGTGKTADSRYKAP